MSDADSAPASPREQQENDNVESTRQNGGHNSDKDSDLSEIDEEQFDEIDEDQFDDYNRANDDKPAYIDASVAQTLKAAKRKRTDGVAVKKPKEGRRPKKRARGDDDVDMDDAGDAPAARRPRKSRTDGEERRAARKEAAAAAAAAEEENEENLTPEERKRRALDRAIDAAVKGKTKRRRKKDDIDLEDEIDTQIANLKIAMEGACARDNEARDNGQVAVEKLKLLPQVTALLNRTSIQDAVLDPETNFLQSVKFFLEPLSDGSLPAYSIQRDIFTALAKLPINKDTLLSSGIGKVVLFYTRSKRPEIGIKRIAERLLGEWSRPILKRTDDYRKLQIETRDFDFNAAKHAQRQEALGTSSQMTLTQRPAGKTRHELERERMLAPEPINSNRARPAGLPTSYTIAPRSTFDGSQAPGFKPIGANGLEAFRKMTQKGKKRG